MGASEYPIAYIPLERTQPMRQKQFTLTDVLARDGSVLRLSFADGFSADVSLAEVIERHPTLHPLRAAPVFRRVQADEWRLGVVFDDNDALSLASDTLRAMATEQAGGFSHHQLVTWMAHHGMSLDAAAEALGISRRMLAYYRSGQKQIPRAIGLAMVGWDVVQVRGTRAVLHYDAA